MIEAVLRSRVCLIWRRSQIGYLQALDKEEICLEKERFVSKMKQSLCADSVGVMEGFDGRETEGWLFWIFVKEGQ